MNSNKFVMPGRRVEYPPIRPYKTDKRPLDQIAEEFISYLTRLEKFEDWTAYDQEVLKGTCFLGGMKNTHAAVEENGIIEIATGKFPVDIKPILDCIYKKENLKTDPSLTITKGKSTRWPLWIPSSDRAGGDIAMLLSAEYVIDRQKRKFSLADMLAELGQYFGASICMYAERYQHTSKEVILRHDGVWSSKNLANRTRMIQAPSPIAIYANKPIVNAWIDYLVKHPVHTQDRKEIQRRIDQSQWKHKYAIDHSTMDRRLGDKVEQILRYAARNEKEADDLMTEAKIPKTIRYNDQLYYVDGLSFLGSGSSFTTLANCLGAVVAVILALAEARKTDPVIIAKQFGQTWDMLGWGDDGVLFVNEEWDVLSPIFAKAGWKVTLEPVLRYLGEVYDPKERRYPAGRFAQNVLFPEHTYEDINLFSLAMKSRELKLDDKHFYDSFIDEFNKDLLKSFPDTIIPMAKDVFRPTETELLKIVSYVGENYGKLATQVDNVLYSLGHGVVNEESLAYLGIDLDDILSDREAALSYDKLVTEYGHLNPNSIWEPGIVQKLKKIKSLR